MGWGQREKGLQQSPFLSLALGGLSDCLSDCLVSTQGVRIAPVYRPCHQVLKTALTRKQPSLFFGSKKRAVGDWKAAD